MPATPVTSILTGNPLLDAIDGGERWSGVITYNRLTPGTAEVQQFAAELPADYATDGRGLTDAMWNAVSDGLRLLGAYASFSHAITDAADANYLVSDFYKPSNVNNAGIAASPGSGPILAYNVRNWDAYSPGQQTFIELHELGHTLGLRHPDGLPPELQFSQYTLMASDWQTLGNSWEGTGLPLTPMALDVAVLQSKYGAPATNTGNTGYWLHNIGSSYVRFAGEQGAVDNGSQYICIWDTAGYDVLVAVGSGISFSAPAALINLNAATLTTTAYTGALAEVIGEVAETSGIFARLSALAKAEITDPVRSAGGFFSSRIALDGERNPAGYTIAHGSIIEEGRGKEGSDLIIGNEAANLLDGGEGNDELYGGAGTDSLAGSQGDDRLFGGTGNDTVQDVSGSNFLRGGEGGDSISGGAAFDDAHGNMGDDTVSGGGGGDWVVGGKDNDLLFGEGDADVVWGNLGNDTHHGGDGNDQVRGGQGDDIVNGDAGDDYVSGDRGADTITGGAGADRFHGSQDAGLDRVLDFNRVQGDIVLLDPGTTYTVGQIGADTVIDMGGGHQMILVGVQYATLSDGWVVSAWG